MGEADGFLYVALGDSISIDLYAGGPGRGGPSLLARNRDDDFPEWRGRDLATLHPRSRFELLALDGATVPTVLDVQLPQLRGIDRRPDLVSLTIGGAPGRCSLGPRGCPRTRPAGRCRRS